MLPSPSGGDVGIRQVRHREDDREDHDRPAPADRARSDHHGQARGTSAPRTSAAGASIKHGLARPARPSRPSEPPSRSHPAPAVNTPSSMATAAGRMPNTRPDRDAPSGPRRARHRSAVASSPSARTPTTHVARPKATQQGHSLHQREEGVGCAARSWTARAPGQAPRDRDQQEGDEQKTENVKRDDGADRPEHRARAPSGRRARSIGPAHPRAGGRGSAAAARPTLSRSPVKNGRKPTRKAAAGLPPSRRAARRRRRESPPCRPRTPAASARIPAERPASAPVTAAASGNASR